jgi:putative transposase
MDKFKNKYRVPSIRLRYWNYGWNAAYFVTICTINRIHYFGEIRNRKMTMSDIGRCAQKCWYDIPNHFPFVVLRDFVVMPDHIHGIVVIDKPDKGMTDNGKARQSKNLASIIRGYKIGVTKYARGLDIYPVWQPNYYEHIIRDENAYNNIARYIKTNPLRWHSPH